MAREDIKAILEKIRSGEFTPEEERIAKYWLMKLEQQEPTDLTDEELENISKEMWASLETLPAAQPKIKRLWPRIAAAAAILVFLSAGLFVWHHKKEQAANNLVSNFGGDIKPGHNQATLTLADGKKIILTKGLSGQLATQNQTVINASQNNIIYDAKNQTGEQVSYNTLSTARGEQSPYPLVLADGTKVWLNAESSITFPTAFNQKERIVKITGEAYFDVAHDSKHPFKVQTPAQTIEDIGTSFNVNAYADENATRTTLISGSVKINNLVLKPGEQSDGSHIKTVNTEIYTAWKEGNFHFEDQDIKTIMRQLARWYDIEVEYQGNMTKNTFYADISRNRNISAALKVLQNSNGVHFKIEGRRVTVIE